MDGNQDLSKQSPVLRVRVNAGQVIERVLKPSHAPARVIVPWTFGALVLLEYELIAGRPWLTVRGESAGLPIARDDRREVDHLSWQGLWDDEVVEIEEREDGSWVIIENLRKWGVIHA